MAEERDGISSWARRFGRVEDATKGVDLEALSEDQLEQDTARWMNLAQAGASLAIATATGDINAVTEQSAAVFRALLDVDEAQERLLNSIDENVKLLLSGPFKTGREFLETAQRLVNSPERSKTYVEKAQEKFYEGHSLATEPMDLAVVEVHIAVTHFLLGNLDDTSATLSPSMIESQHWLKSAYDRSASMALELAAETGNTEVIKWVERPSWKRSLSALAIPGYAYYRVAKSSARTVKNSVTSVRNAKKKRSNERAQKGIRAVLPLVSCIASLYAATGADPAEVPALKLNEVKQDQYELVAVIG